MQTVTDCTETESSGSSVQWKAQRCYDSPSRQLKNDCEIFFHALRGRQMGASRLCSRSEPPLSKFLNPPMQYDVGNQCGLHVHVHKAVLNAVVFIHRSMQLLASYPVPRPAFRRCLVPLYRTKQRRKAGRGTGNEAMQLLLLHH